jgi:hypothetical protein
MGLAFTRLDGRQSRELVELVFTGDNSWTQQDYPRDRVLRSFWYLVTTLWRVGRHRRKAVPPRLEGVLE